MKITKNSPILNSAIKAWNGEEKLWKVFWLWGVLLYISSFYLGFIGILIAAYLFKILSPYNLDILMTIFSFFYFIFIFLCAFTITFIYPLIFLIALNRCCHNKSSKVAIKLFSIFAICGHSLFSVAFVCGIFAGFIGTCEVLKKIADCAYYKITENILDSKIERYYVLSVLIYSIILYYLIDALIRFFNQNTRLPSRKLSFKIKLFNNQK